MFSLPENAISSDANVLPEANGMSNVSVLIDPLDKVTESSKDNNWADKTVFVLPVTTTTIPYQPDPSDLTTTTLNGSCIMPGNTPPCNVMSLEEVVAGITEWSKGNMQLNVVLALINSWADPVSYPPA